MKKKSMSSRILSSLLALVMVLSAVPLSVSAASKGDLANVDTGLSGNIDTDKVYSLPITILDYEADGMLFEFAESNGQKKPSDFGATYVCDYTDDFKDVNGYTGDKTDTVIYKYTADYSVNLQNSGNDGQFMRVNYLSDGDNDGTDYITNFTSSVYDDATGTDYKLSQIRYLVFVYRCPTAGTISSSSMSFSLYTGTSFGSDPSASKKTNEFSISRNDNWKYQIVDLYETGEEANTAVNGILMNSPVKKSGDIIDVAYAVYFDTDSYALAQAFAEYAVTKGSDNGDHRGFGMLRGSNNESGTTVFDAAYEHSDTASTVKLMSTYKDSSGTDLASIDFSTIDNFGYKLFGIFDDNGIGTAGLLESSLSDEGYPVYKEKVVSYLANLLQVSLEIPERTEDGWKNYKYIKGTPSDVYGGVDFATALRTRINADDKTDEEALGAYDESAAKGLIGTWEKVEGKISTYFDAAYFMLNSIFVDNSYNVPQDDYKYLVLSQGTDADTGDTVHVFDAGFATTNDPDTAEMAIAYDTDAKTIQNSSAAGKAHFYYTASNTTTLNPFLPVTDRNTEAGQTKSVYWQDDGLINTVKKQANKDTLYKHNFNFAIKSEGEFVYRAEDNLFFDFEGDDDVYLFINGELVMDIGGAHSINHVRFELNDYVNAAKAGTDLGSTKRNEALNLKEGQSYSFRFYYMERHSYGSNMRIMTNIPVTDPFMKVEKTAYQNGVQIAYGGIVDKDAVVEYGFTVENPVNTADDEIDDSISIEPLVELAFDDHDIGIRISHDKGLEVTGSDVYMLDGTKLTSSNVNEFLEAGLLKISRIDSDGNEIPYEVKNQDNVKSILNDPGQGTADDPIGLISGEKLVVRGFGYKLTKTQVEAGFFDNTVYAEATGEVTGEPLQSQARMRVYVPADPMYYQWAGKPLVVTIDKLITDVKAAAADDDNILHKDNEEIQNLTAKNIKSVAFVNRTGDQTIVYDHVAKASNNDLTINYPEAGSYVFYVKITYSTSSPVTVPVLVNVPDVKDSSYVLDYGLEVDLTAALFTKEDQVAIPGRSTNTSIMAISSQQPSYTSNTIGFTADTDGQIAGSNGTFKLADGKLTYTPTDFLDSADSVWVAVNVYEGNSFSPVSSEAGQADDTGIDINNEVQMYKKITVLPATVMYYEDYFSAISYPDHTRTTPGTVYTQSADQDENYGHDAAYQTADAGNLNSSNSVQTLEITDSSTLASFTIAGSGFELIARTDAETSGTIIVDGNKQVQKSSSSAPASAHILDLEITRVPDASMLGEGSSGAQTHWRVPVIMQFDNGNDFADNEINEAIYQVPVIRYDFPSSGTYIVNVIGVPKRDHANGGAVLPSYLYFDGLRVFQPIGASNSAYSADENGAVFYEVRDEIAGGQIAVASYTADTAKVVTSGTMTWTEDYSDGGVFTDVSSVEAYLFSGPNNEAYMRDGAAMVFYVKETGTGAHSLQVALRAVDYFLASSGVEVGMEAAIQYGIIKDGAFAWAPLVTAKSGTEQYYTIDYTQCPQVNGAYQIALRVNGDETEQGMVSYSSLKLVGLELTEAITVSSGSSPAISAICAQMDATEITLPASNVIVPKPYAPIQFPEKPQDKPEQNEPETDGNEEGKNEERKEDLIPLLSLCKLDVTAGDGGTVTPEGDLVIAFGAKRVIKAVPDEGYEVEGIYVNGKNVGAAEKYTVVATGNMKVEVKFVKTDASAE